MSCDQKICRGCLAADRKMASAILYEAEFKHLTGIDISPSDGLPHWLCYECVALLRKCIKFRDKVMKSHYTLCQYVMEIVPFPSDKDGLPYLSQTCISHYDFPGTQTEKPENLTKDDVVNDIGISVSVEVENVKVEDETELCKYEDTITAQECCEKIPSMDVAIKLSPCSIVELNTMSICSATSNNEERFEVDPEKNKNKPLTKEETKGLLSLIEHSKIINNKKTNATSNKMKVEEWVRIADAFNASVGTCRRTPQQLRLKWENLKKNSRKRSALLRMERIKIEDIIKAGVDDLNLERVKVKNDNPSADYDDNIAIEKVSLEEQIELISKTSTCKLDHNEQTELKKVEENISLGVGDLNSQIVEIKEESSCSDYDDDDITIEELSIEEQIELRSKSSTHKLDHKEQTELDKVEENMSLDASELNSEIVEIQDDSSDYDDVIRLELSVEEQMKSRRKSLRHKPQHTELGKLLLRARRDATVSRRARRHVDEDTDEEVDVVSLDTPHPTRKESLRLYSLRPRRYIKRTANTATTPNSQQSTPRKRIPPPSLPTTSRHTRRSKHKNPYTVDLEYDSPEEGRRYLHNDMERKRRHNIKDLFNELRREVPAAKYARCTSKISILKEATALCRKLSQENVEREQLKMKQNKLLMKLNRLCGRRAPRKP